VDFGPCRILNPKVIVTQLNPHRTTPALQSFLPAEKKCKRISQFDFAEYTTRMVKLGAHVFFAIAECWEFNEGTLSKKKTQSVFHSAFPVAQPPSYGSCAAKLRALFPTFAHGVLIFIPLRVQFPNTYPFSSTLRRATNSLRYLFWRETCSAEHNRISRLRGNQTANRSRNLSIFSNTPFRLVFSRVCPFARPRTPSLCAWLPCANK